MSTLENTISMLESLPETDLIRLQDLVKSLFQQQQRNCPFPLKNKGDLYRDLEISRKQAAEGKCMEMGQVISEIRNKYGI